MKRLILKTFQCPGDVLMLTAAVRDLLLTHPGKFQVDVRTSVPALWMHNTRLTPLEEGQPGVESIDMHYPLVHQSNQRPYHFLHGYPQYLEQRLGVAVLLTKFAGEVFLSQEEKQEPSQVEKLGHAGPFWIIVAGGKYDFTAKWWDPERYQAVVDHYQSRIQFVQCGEDGHWHPRLKGVIDLVGNTSPREFIRLMHHAQGVICGVTYAMHLSAAVETKPGQPARRPCVVVAGGREPTHWEAYPQHQYLTTSGLLSCCADGGCWKSRCQLVGDGDVKDRDELCTQPVQLTPELRIPRCLDLITPEDVIRRIDMYLEGGTLALDRPRTITVPSPQPINNHQPAHAAEKTKVLIDFRHGLGDAVQLSIVLAHLRRFHPDWQVTVAALVGKHSAFNGQCHQVLIKDREVVDRSRYDRVFELDWPECPASFADSPSTKAEFCLRDVFQITPVPELCQYTIRISERAHDAARAYLTSVCRQSPKDGRFPTVVIHYQGNTSMEKKDLPHDLMAKVCKDILHAGYVPVILDWDGRTTLADNLRVHNPGVNAGLWNGVGTGDADTIAALIEASTLMIGIDSGPLHVAGATSTPTIGVWTGHHPLHYFGLSENVTHLVPHHHAAQLRAPSDVGQRFFRDHFYHVTYNDLEPGLRQLVQDRLAEVQREEPPKLRSTAYSQDYYHEHKDAGLDYLNYGDWQRDYGRWLVETFELRGKAVLDVGCACGSILNGFVQAGALGCGIDLCEPMVQLGRQKFPDLRLDICDAANLHLFSENDFAFIHSAQSAEHFKPDLVPHILRELFRVAQPGAMFFCALDTQELYDRQGRDGLREDPTHICIRPLKWWHDQLAETGWELSSEQTAQTVKQHRLSFLRKYDWDWFIARKPVAAAGSNGKAHARPVTFTVAAEPAPVPYRRPYHLAGERA